MGSLSSLFKKVSNNNIYAPVSGFCADITKIDDEMFAGKMLGDGFLIIPESDTVCSPCSGKLTMLFPTLHAFGITMDNGQEILVHIGINTVELNGKYFEKLCDVNKHVSAGTPVIKYDFNKVVEAGYDPNVLVIVVNNKDVIKENLNSSVRVGDLIIREQGYESN